MNLVSVQECMEQQLLLAAIHHVLTKLLGYCLDVGPQDIVHDGDVIQSCLRIRVQLLGIL